MMLAPYFVVTGGPYFTVEVLCLYNPLIPCYKILITIFTSLSTLFIVL